MKKNEMGGPCDTHGEQKSLQGFSAETLDVLDVDGSIRGLSGKYPAILNISRTGCVVLR